MEHTLPLQSKMTKTGTSKTNQSPLTTVINHIVGMH